MKPKLTFEQAHDLLNRFHEACKKDLAPAAEEISVLRTALTFIISGRDTINGAIGYIDDKTAKNLMKGAGK